MIKKILNVDVERSFRETCAFCRSHSRCFVFMVKRKLFVGFFSSCVNSYDFHTFMTGLLLQCEHGMSFQTRFDINAAAWPPLHGCSVSTP